MNFQNFFEEIGAFNYKDLQSIFNYDLQRVDKYSRFAIILILPKKLNIN
jgi:hypothetical protein